MSKARKVLLLAMSVFLGRAWLARKLGVIVGVGCRIYNTEWGSEPFLIEIGNRVTVTASVLFLTHDGATWLVRDGEIRYQRYGSIKVGNDVFIGVNSVLMPDIVIGNRVVVAAGAVVSKSVPDNSVVAGVPARVISTFDAYEKRVREKCVRDDSLVGLDHRERVMSALRGEDER